MNGDKKRVAEGEDMQQQSAEKPISLKPLSVDEALSGLLQVKPPPESRSEKFKSKAQKKNSRKTGKDQ